MQRYSALSLFLQAIRKHRDWAPAWRNPEPRKQYDAVIIGAGGHGLATAWYLASKHGMRNIAVLERNHLGSGNSGRNTQICRSNYFHPEASAFYEHSLQLYETLGLDLNFNIMFGQQGLLTLYHDRDEEDLNQRWMNAMALNGIETQLLDREQVRRKVPLLQLDGRYPVVGGFLQDRAGISRHDAVVWGYARAASRAGVDIVQNCEVTGFVQSDSHINAVETTRGRISASQFIMCVAGNSSQLAARAGFRLPLRSIALQAMVTEPVKPVLDCIVSSNLIHFYISQSDRGELVIGGASDYYNSYAQRGALPATLDNAAATVEMFPCLARMKVMRQWAGVCDIAPDASPIMGPSPIENLHLSTGWGTGGFKAIPAGGDCLAWSVANGKLHPLIEPFTLARFDSGALVDEAAAAGVAH
jgi:sarcosine oxidase subunit beta